MAYSFTYSSLNELHIENNDGSIQITLPRPSIELATDKIYINDPSINKWEQVMRFIDFGLIDGVQPTSIQDAYDRLVVMQESINSSPIEVEVVSESNGVTCSIVSSSLSSPLILAANTYFSYTISTTGSVTIDGVLVPEGSWTWSSGVNDLLSSKTISTTGSGSVIVTTQQKA